MTRALASLAAAAFALAGLATSAAAELPVGEEAPAFTTQAALAGKEFGFSLSAALAKGPVVLYFYPKAFTQGWHFNLAAIDGDRPLHPHPQIIALRVYITPERMIGRVGVAKAAMHREVLWPAWLPALLPIGGGCHRQKTHRC
jgi:hypothetical protein